ncbi:prolyl oligopeptidase family serine peptidase [Paraferrimonas sp. SM1919]|uniref:prolyl oligopeptidase family serine peptidase n=1 Tax=Paraferrimonas sp. SM1919 TaxID=2662263 RepID=UPI001969F892|nr:prolyl oligopeptidase family serine peptidase [Paraferrimonas sp. SM1919]
MKNNTLTAALILGFSLFTLGCGEQEQQTDTTPTPVPPVTDNGIPVIKADSTYSVLTQYDITYAEGLTHNTSSTSPVAMPQLLDVYYPNNDSTNRPLFMFIHGGGFKGGTKTKPEIVEMGNYFAARGWVFASIDYRTAEDLGVIQGMSPEQLLNYYQGIAPTEWIEHALQAAQSADEVMQATAMYTAQRDAKAALRWLVANSTDYNINTDYITVGGASAGSITTIALGISELEDFRDEISINDDPTLATANTDQSYKVNSMVYFWGSNIKLDVFEGVYGINRYDSNDPELFMAHGTAEDPVTPYAEALELQDIYNDLGVHSTLATLEGYGHGAWHAQVDGKGLFELTFDFLVERQQLVVE